LGFGTLTYLYTASITMKKLTWFVFFSIIAVSCLDEPDCFQLNNNSVVIAFKILGAGADEFALVGIISPETDSVFYGYQIVPSAELPLNPLDVQTRYSFQGVYGDNEIQLGYTRQVQFVSADCGERYIFADLKIMEHDFDSARVVYATPTAPASTNIEIYRCPRTNLMGIDLGDKQLVEGVTAGFSTFIFLPSDSLTTIDLPLNKDDSTTTFVFDFGAVSKTLKVKYTRTNKTRFEICGEQTLFSNLLVDTAITDFSSATILKDSIQDLPIINLEITL